MDDIDNLKNDPRVLRVYGSYTRLSKDGKEWVGLCPLHSEKSPSFKVREAGGTFLWNCFGCDQKGGNIFQLIQRKDGVDFKTALAKVKDFLGENNWESQAQAVDAVFKPAVESSKTYKTMTLAEYAGAERALASNLSCQEWLLKERGISLSTAQKLHLGFAKSVGRLAGEKNADIADKGWVSFPCIEDGVVVAIKYRSVVRKAFCKQGGMATALFNTETIDLFEPVYLVEGELDASALEQAGFHAVSLQSASTYPTPEQKDQLMRAGMVILAGDNDGGVGEGIMQKLWRELAERTYMLHWPEGTKDANQFFLETCKGDTSKFKAEIDKLTQAAKTQPMPDVYSLVETLRSNNESSLHDNPSRLHLPWPSVDKMVILVPGSVFATYATQTGMGKTCWTTQIALHGARKHGEVVVSYQCELSPEEVANIVSAQVLRKNRGAITKEDRHEVADILEGVKFYIGNNPNLSDANEILDLLEAAVRRLGATILVIDHFHHMTRAENNENAIQGAAARRIKSIAQKYKLKVINVGQPRKATQASKGRRTHITDAKGNGAFADDADAVAALHRDLVKTDGDTPAQDMYEPKTLVQMQKTRAKGTGAAEAYLMFFGEFGCFEEIETRYEEPEGEIRY